MIQVYKEYTKATCVKDLSHIADNISSDLYEEKFPLIGKTYKIESIFLMNEKRDNKGRCVPNNPWDIGFDILVVHLFGWTTQENIFDEQEGFSFHSFMYSENSDTIYQFFKDRGVNIRVPSYREDLEKIYKTGSWKPKKSKDFTFKISDASRSSPESKAFGKMMKQEMAKGGRYYDKPYHGLQVKNGFVVEEGKVTEEQEDKVSIDLEL